MTLTKMRDGFPSTWIHAKLADVCEVESGAGFPKLFQGLTKGDYPFAKVSDISDAVRNSNAILKSAANYLSQDGAKKLRAKIFPIGTTLFAKIGEAVPLNRRVIAAVPVLADNNVMGLIPKEQVDPKYLFYFMHTIELYEYSQATTVPSVRKTDVESIEIPIPPFPEQQRIVAKIEELFTRLDAGVAALKRVRAALKRYKAAVLKAACEGRLVPQDPNDEPAAKLLERILAERRAKWEESIRAGGKLAKYIEPQEPDLAESSELPSGWAWATLEQLTDQRRAITYGVVKLGDPDEEGIPTLRSSNVRHMRLDLDEVKRISPSISNQYKRTILQGGEILVTVRGTLGGIAKVPSACMGYNISREVALIALVDRGLGPVIEQFLGSPPSQVWLMKNTKGIAYTGINIETLKAMPIPVPPLLEQRQIVFEVERRLSVIQELEATVAANLARAERMRQSILKRAFEGKLVPQDPNDEPARMLLERIR